MNTEDPSGSDCMKANVAYQPRPYPNRCSICGGTGFLFAKQGESDVVKWCECRVRRIAEKAAKKGRKRG